MPGFLLNLVSLEFSIAHAVASHIIALHPRIPMFKLYLSQVTATHLKDFSEVSNFASQVVDQANPTLK